MVDGLSKKIGAGIGIILLTLDLSSIEHSIQLEFPTSNDEVEYEALIVKILVATESRVKNVNVCNESDLVVVQLTGKF